MKFALGEQVPGDGHGSGLDADEPFVVRHAQAHEVRAGGPRKRRVMSVAVAGALERVVAVEVPLVANDLPVGIDRGRAVKGFHRPVTVNGSAGVILMRAVGAPVRREGPRHRDAPSRSRRCFPGLAAVDLQPAPCVARARHTSLWCVRVPKPEGGHRALAEAATCRRRIPTIRKFETSLMSGSVEAAGVEHDRAARDRAGAEHGQRRLAAGRLRAGSTTTAGAHRALDRPGRAEVVGRSRWRRVRARRKTPAP